MSALALAGDVGKPGRRQTIIERLTAGGFALPAFLLLVLIIIVPL
jgi:hypothetical protein